MFAPHALRKIAPQGRSKRIGVHNTSALAPQASSKRISVHTTGELKTYTDSHNRCARKQQGFAPQVRSKRTNARTTSELKRTSVQTSNRVVFAPIAPIDVRATGVTQNHSAGALKTHRCSQHKCTRTTGELKAHQGPHHRRAQNVCGFTQ